MPTKVQITSAIRKLEAARKLIESAKHESRGWTFEGKFKGLLTNTNHLLSEMRNFRKMFRGKNAN